MSSPELPHFPADEQYEVRDVRWGRPELPGESWSRGNMFENTVLWMPNWDPDEMVFDDKTWWMGQPDKLRLLDRNLDPVLANLFNSAAMRRTQAVEQLTSPPEYTTIPNTAAFSRFEHLAGSVFLVEQLGEKAGLNRHEITRAQLRTGVSDLGHGFGSHIWDWVEQGISGNENQHDLDLMRYLEATGVNDLLRQAGWDPDEVVFPDIVDFVEAPQPDLCIDRADYGLREMNRWNSVVRRQNFTAEDFTITPEGMLAMVDQRRARIFSEGYLLLSQEHWSEPTHRFMLDMQMLKLKLFYAQGGTPRDWVFAPGSNTRLMNLNEINPKDLKYVTDVSQSQAYAYPNLITDTLDSIMRAVAQYRRQYIWPGRSERISMYMMQFVDESDYSEQCQSGRYLSLEDESFDTYHGEYPVNLPIGFAILDAETASATESDAAIDFPQSHLKVRQIDPLIRSGSSFCRLSELDPSYARRLEEHRTGLQRHFVARIMAPDSKANTLLRTMMDNAEEHWERQLAGTRRMTPAELRSLVDVSARNVIGHYPFMTYLSY